MIPPKEEWLTLKQVATMYGISIQRVYKATGKDGRRSVSGARVRLQTFMTLGGLRTTKRMVEEFLMKLNK